MAQPTSLYVNTSPTCKASVEMPMARSAKCKSPQADAANGADRNTPALNVRGSAEMGCRKGGCRAFKGREQCFSRAFSGRVERLQAFHSVARLFTALIA
jgi:hypothetical protein